MVEGNSVGGGGGVVEGSDEGNRSVGEGSSWRKFKALVQDKASLYTEYINEKKKTHFVFMVQRNVPSRLTIHSCLAIQQSDEAVNTPSFQRLKGNSTDGGTG